MNAEYLLNAIGLLDDDLVREAERYRRPKGRYGLMLGWAASFAVVLALSYALTHLGMGGGAPSSGGGNSMAPANGGAEAPMGGYSGADAPSASVDDRPGGGREPDASEMPAPSSGEDHPSAPQDSLLGAVFVHGAQGGGTYVLSGEILAELPEGGEYVLLGELLALEPDSPRLSTNVEAYVGLNLWADGNGTDLPLAVYVELPAGGFARAELAQP